LSTFKKLTNLWDSVGSPFAGQKEPNCSSAARLPGRKRQTDRRQLVCRAESAKLIVGSPFAGQKEPNCSSAARLPGRKCQTVCRQPVCRAKRAKLIVGSPFAGQKVPN